jgi:hypothetical protein
MGLLAFGVIEVKLPPVLAKVIPPQTVPDVIGVQEWQAEQFASPGAEVYPTGGVEV